MTRSFTTYLAIALMLLMSPRMVAAETQISAHQRVVALQGVQNFRDLGGYRTADGHTVKWGLLYRSGALASLTPDGVATLEHLGIKTVTDFRSTEERQHAPVNWAGAAKPAIYATDYAETGSPFGAVIRDPSATAEQARKAFEAVYAELPYRFAAQYRRMFAELVAGHAPLIFNCTAGKDRTGVAAALLLSALGAPRAAVIEDFMLSGQYFHGDKLVTADTRPDNPWRKVSPEVMKVLWGVEPGYIEAAFVAIDRRSGLEDYLHHELGLTPADVAILKTRYLE